MNLQILDKTKKNKITEQLNKQFGIEKIPHLLIQTGKDKIRGFTGSLSKDELMKLARNINIETLGLYLFRIHDDGIRLSIDACHALKEQISKNIIEINEEQTQEWFKGRDLEISGEAGYKILKHKEDFLGCGKLSHGNFQGHGTSEKANKLSQGRLVNFVPKERRIKS